MKYRKQISIILFCLYIAAVAFLCFMQGEQLPELPKTWFGIPADKVAHALMFFPFTILGYLSFTSEENTTFQKTVILVILIAVGWGMAYATESIQRLLGYRAYEISDMKADLIGLTAGAFFSGLLIIFSLKKIK
ncbi:MAG: VanZ family protein [Bacteroidales bacterium]|nr:VanZ family protein [Bacteroidales bacterium]MBR5862405.1 VanZ family protein [Bacteroidales bacterium]